MNRSLALIVCTYQRPDALGNLLTSVSLQKKIPQEILIVDGSKDDWTYKVVESFEKINESIKLDYYIVPEEHRGLTKQRNYGIERVNPAMDVVAFLDDDIILQPDYFKNLLETYEQYPETVGVGGYIVNESNWELSSSIHPNDLHYFYFDGYRRKESSRYRLRRKLGLAQKQPPGFYPEFGHGRSVGFLPPSGKIYQTETLMGGVSSFPLKILKQYKFSEYFEGYGLYEDADFTLRLSKIGKLYINTAAQLEHHHDSSGRPNAYLYGKMVVRNGWYVWRVKYPHPSFKDRLKWYSITIILILIRFSNAVTSDKKSVAWNEAIGRLISLITLAFKKPSIEK